MCLYVSAAVSYPSTISPKATKASALPLYHIGPEIPWETSTNYELSSNTQPNGLYAINSPHPSQRIIARDPYNKEIFLDTEVSFKAPFNMTSFTIKPTTESDAFFIGSTVHDTHLYGFGTCENLEPCPAGALPGSYCSVTQWGINVGGFCYTAADSTLQCGRGLETEGRFGHGHKNVDGTISRCPAGIPLSRPGRLVVRRLLLGGCLISSDANYLVYADVHVPDACATPADLATGCLFPGATNYAPGSVQSGTCHYRTVGCTSSTALNYNPEATIPDGSCVEPVYGCTLKTASFDGVAAGTPGHQELHVGVPATNVGTITLPTIGNVKAYNQNANVLSGCEIVIEGCMDSTAINYEPRANSQTYTWCVPRFTGCMMPTQKTHSTSMNTLSEGAYTRTHAKDSGSANFDPSATVNQLSTCIVGRVGCMSSTALNYDPKATFNEGCFEPTEGCHDRTALNYNCTTREGYTVCTDAYPRATNHSAAVCNYFVAPPPATSPSVPRGAPTTTAVVIEIIASGSVSDYTEEDKSNIAQAYASAAGVPVEDITVEIRPASVVISTTIKTADEAAATQVQNTVSAALGNSADSAASFLNTATGLNVQVLSTPVVESKVVVLVGPPSPPPAVPVGAIVGGVIGGIFPTLIAAGAYYMYKKKKAAKTTYPA